ncbi:hypothetical protein KKC1_31670, partial [Calderihabitans maritimus]
MLDILITARRLV